MKVQAVKGTRDFYPPVMAVRNYLIDGWKSASLRHGFAEYDGPIFEYLKMYQIKSGDEIVEQLFSFQDRGGRDLAQNWGAQKIFHLIGQRTLTTDEERRAEITRQIGELASQYSLYVPY